MIVAVAELADVDGSVMVAVHVYWNAPVGVIGLDPAADGAHLTSMVPRCMRSEPSLGPFVMWRRLPSPPGQNPK